MEEEVSSELKIEINGMTYGNLAINLLFERLVTGFSDFYETNEINGEISETQFKSAYADIYISSRMIYSLLVYSCFVEQSLELDEDMYKQQLFSVTVEQAQTRKESFISSIGKNGIDEKQKKLRKRLSTMIPESMGVYVQLIKKTSPIERTEIISKAVEGFQSNKTQIEALIKDNTKPIEVKARELFIKMDDIFINDINNRLGFNLETFDLKGYLLMLLKDAFTLICLQLIFEQGNNIEKRVVEFSKNSWYIYFLMVILDEYKRTGINILRTNKNPVLLKYGINISESLKIAVNFLTPPISSRVRGSLKEIPDNTFQDFPNLPFEIYYILLGYGASRRESYEAFKSSSKDKDTKISFKMSNINNVKTSKSIFEAKIVQRNFRIRRIVEGMVMSEYSRKFIAQFNELYEQAVADYADLTEVNVNLEEGLIDVINSCPSELQDEWIAFKEIASTKPISERTQIVYDFVKEILQKFSTLGKSYSEKAENFKELIKPVLSQTGTVIQKNVIETLGNNIFIQNNFFSPERFEKEKKLKEFLIKKEEYQQPTELLADYSEIISTFDILKGTDFVKSKIEKKLRENALKKITINTGFDYDEEGKRENEKYSVYLRGFYLVSVYEKIFLNDEALSRSFLERFNFDLKEQELFFSLVTDLVIMNVLKEERKFLSQNVIMEIDYLPEIIKKIDKYFKYTFLEEEKIEKLGFRETEKANNMLMLFESALKFAYLLYYNPVEYLKEAEKRKKMEEEEEKEEELENESLYEDFEQIIDNTINVDKIFN